MFVRHSLAGWVRTGVGARPGPLEGDELAVLNGVGDGPFEIRLHADQVAHETGHGFRSLSAKVLRDVLVNRARRHESVEGGGVALVPRAHVCLYDRLSTCCRRFLLNGAGRRHDREKTSSYIRQSPHGILHGWSFITCRAPGRAVRSFPIDGARLCCEERAHAPY